MMVDIHMLCSDSAAPSAKYNHHVSELQNHLTKHTLIVSIISCYMANSQDIDEW